MERPNKQTFYIDNDVERAVGELKKPGSFIAIDVYDHNGEYMSVYDVHQELSNELSIQLYCLSLHDPNKVIFKFDFSVADIVEKAKPILESFQIVKVMQKCIYLSYVLQKRYNITLHAVIDLAAFMHFVNTTLNIANSQLNLKLTQTTSNDVKSNMFRLIKTWIRLHNAIYGNLNKSTEYNLERFRSKIE